MSSNCSTPSTPDWSTCSLSDSDISTPPTSPEPTSPLESAFPPPCEPLTTYSSNCSVGSTWRTDCCQSSGSLSVPMVPNLESYMAFRRDAYHDAYECGSDCRKCVPGMARYITDTPTDSVMAKAATDAESILELAARCATGCGAPFEPEAALLFTDIVLKRHGAYERVESLSVSDTEHTHAHGAAALAYLTKYRLKDTAGTLSAYLKDPDLLHAVMDAHAAIDHGLRFPGAFEIADVVLQLGEAHGQDVRGGERFGEGKYRQLWRAYDVRQRILEKMRLAPSRYMCAEPSCGFRSLKARQFRRCAGSCAPEDTPSYCSKACQRKDWARHKAVCGPRQPKSGSTHPEALDTPFSEAV